jgi:drug/metabolite transporter (DMT)-like permease
MKSFQIFEKPSRFVAIAEGVLATLVWASSFVFVKIGLDYMGPLTIAGLRYFLASLLLLPFAVRRGNTNRPWASSLWLRLFLIGFSAYVIGNGAMFWGLKYLPATTGSFMMSFSPLLILFAGTVWLKEIPTRRQIIGVMVALAGSVLFFSSGLRVGEPLGLGIVAVGLLGFLFFGILGREVAREQKVDTLSLTAIPLAFGGSLLLLVALPLEGLPAFSVTGWGIVFLLAVINTAFAYILYNHSLQVLTALEMNVMLNLSPLGTAVLAWLLLDERLSIIQIIGMITAIIGVVLVQRENLTP